MRLWRHPRRSIRLRLAALLTVLFVLLGGTLLGVSYALVRSNLTVDHDELAEAAAERLGLEAGPGPSGDPAHDDVREALRQGVDAEDLPRSVLKAVPDRQRFVAEIQDVQEELADDALRELTLQYLGILAAMAVLSGALGWFVSGRVLRPVSDITATARSVSKESLHERINLDGPDDELKRLADTFDSMLARLEAGFERERAFVSNASHELRTPLSVIRTEADVTLADEADDPEALRRAVAVMRDAGQRSEQLVDALLALARADRGDHPWIEVDLGALVQQLTDEADLDGLRLELALRPARVLGDRELLRTMAANLIDNAVRHNSADGWVEIRTESAGQEAQLEVSNSGARITVEQAASLTEPFYRLGTARTGDSLGLGLSIAASVARAHGGRLAIEPLERGGLRVSARLPEALVSGDRSDGDNQLSRGRPGTDPIPTADAGAAPESGRLSAE
jgi:signal transduction histidine kinase